ncbi:cardiolipin synthase [Bacillus sp. Bva_UNVM-123]|uniref:cardiolipin synthase n=1 Tax=Bacillus sp. Bva_UNVM-123 TaxID=2829798 RepID=UPI00391F10D0
MTTLIITTVLIVIILWLTLDFKLGKKKHLKKQKRKPHPFRQSDFSIFDSGPELFKDYFSELKKAKHHIHILFYIVKDDEISTEFLTILKNKANEGIEVRLLLDWLGSHSVKKETIQSLKKHGIEFSFAQKLKLPFLFFSTQVRNHRKISVIDGKIGYIGGFNVGKEYINLDSKLSPWRDYHLKITGEGVEDLQKQFLEDWHEETKINLLANRKFFPLLPKGGIHHQIIPSKGIFLEDTYSGLIRRAKKSIVIGTPYFIPSSKLVADMLSALNRGISLTILVPNTADHILVKEASFPYLRTLLKQGAHVYQFLNGFYHAKVLIIDDDICDIGTANFDERSLFLNCEINCYIHDRHFVEKIKKIVYDDIRDSEALTLNQLKQPNLLRTSKEFIARLAAPFL